MRFIFLIVSCIVPALASAQKLAKPDAMDFAGFEEKAATANWLYIYDRVAWWTTDSIAAQHEDLLDQLGKEWFCFADNNDTWHAVYGNYDNGVYKQAIHYTMDAYTNIHFSQDIVDSAITHPFSRAINLAYNKAWHIMDSSQLSFNHYVRFSKEGHVQVFIFPAMQPENRLAVFGGEFVYTFNPDGTELLKDDSYYQGAFRGFETDSIHRIFLDYTELEEPTLGSVFFALYYKAYFYPIFIQTKKYSHALYKDQSGQYAWMHIETPKAKKAKKKKKS